MPTVPEGFSRFWSTVLAACVFLLAPGVAQPFWGGIRVRPEDALEQHYRCPKCRNGECAVHHVRVPMDVLPLPVGRYLVTTCTLCGYTEFYDQAVYERLAQDAGEQHKILRGDHAADG